MLLHAPSLRTRTWSLSMTVGIRCAMVQTVQSLNSFRIIFWIRLSVAVSTEAVASSSTSIFDCCSRARPRATSCRCPTLQLSPFSRTAGFKIFVKMATLIPNTILFLFKGWGRKDSVFSQFIFLSPTWCIKFLSFLTDNFSKLRLIKRLGKAKPKNQNMHNWDSYNFQKLRISGLFSYATSSC